MRLAELRHAPRIFSREGKQRGVMRRNAVESVCDECFVATWSKFLSENSNVCRPDCRRPGKNPKALTCECGWTARRMSVASFLRCSFVLGLVAKAVFVNSDSRTASAQVHDSILDLFASTYVVASTALATTTTLTMVSLFADLGSVVRAPGQLGVYVGLCVVFVRINVTWIYFHLCPMTQHVCNDIIGSCWGLVLRFRPRFNQG